MSHVTPPVTLLCESLPVSESRSRSLPSESVGQCGCDKTERQTERRTDRRTDRQTDRQTERRGESAGGRQGPEFAPAGLGMAFPQGSPLSRAFSRAVLALSQAGVDALAKYGDKYGANAKTNL